MKKFVWIPLFCALFSTGCSQQEPTTPTLDTASQIPTVESVLEQGTSSQESQNATLETSTQTDVPPGYGSYESVDIDLTTLSSTMVYTQVYTMMMTPEEFVGDTMKMSGIFGYYYDELWDEYYYAVVIMDATACCAQGIEFDLTDAALRTFPDDYPEAGDAVTVVGVYNRFISEEYPDWEYYRLEQAEFITE